MIKMMLSAQDGNLNRRDNRGCTALFKSVQFGCVACLKVMTDAGANADVANRKGLTPVGWLIANTLANYMQLIRYLVSEGRAKVNNTVKVNNESRTYLHMAAYFNQVDVLNYLIELGVDLDSKDDNGKTPLMIAARCGNLEAVKALLDAGCCPDVVCNKRRCASQQAKGKNTKEIKALIKNRLRELTQPDKVQELVSRSASATSTKSVTTEHPNIREIQPEHSVESVTKSPMEFADVAPCVRSLVQRIKILEKDCAGNQSHDLVTRLSKLYSQLDELEENLMPKYNSMSSVPGNNFLSFFMSKEGFAMDQAIENASCRLEERAAAIVSIAFLCEQVQKQNDKITVDSQVIHS